MKSGIRHPGSGYVYVICDVCGRKIRRKDAILIKDKYNTQNNLLVCKQDADKTNPQSIPYTVKERPIADPKSIRVEQPDTYTEEQATRVPGAPKNLKAKTGHFSNQVELTWEGPDDGGSSRITGYQITRSSPQYMPQVVILSSTNGDVTAYTDTTADIDTLYTYQISAINSAGVGEPSNIAPYPKQVEESDVNYLIPSFSNDAFLLDTGNYLSIDNRTPHDPTPGKIDYYIIRTALVSTLDPYAGQVDTGRYWLLYSQHIPELYKGDILNINTEFQVTNPNDWNSIIACAIVMTNSSDSTPPVSTYGIDGSRYGNSNNVTYYSSQGRMCVTTKARNYLVTTNRTNAFINILARTGGSHATPGDIITVEPTGHLSITVFRAT